MRLTREALPRGTSADLIEKAVQTFSSSVTSETQSCYATAARNYIEAEKALGQKFSIPPSESDMVFLATYLINKKLSVTTIRTYLAGIRFYLLSMGVATPPKLPPLAEQLIVGLQKQARDPSEIARKKTRRSITVEMLKLLQHAIACKSDWSDFEKCLYWAVILNAWWGAFRIGELLPKTKNSFDPKSSLLASDITFNEGSVAFWLRSPKVEKQNTGDVVEVWELPSVDMLDPVKVLLSYSRKREKKFGPAEDKPMFLHEEL